MKQTKTTSPQEARKAKPLTRRRAEQTIASSSVADLLVEPLFSRMTKHPNKHVRAKYAHKIGGAT